MTETITEAMMNEHIHVMETDEAIKLVRDLCAQLDSGEERFHGNIWPGNVCINEEGVGILGEASDLPASERNAVQVEYLPPEFFWDNSAEGAGDVYSLGLLLYAGCNGGFLPFQPKDGILTDRDRSEALRRRMKGEAVALPAGISPQLGAVMQKALSYSAEMRYQSPGEFLTALNEMEETVSVAEAAADEVREALEEAMTLDELAQPVVEEVPAEELPLESALPAEEMFAPAEDIALPAETVETAPAAEEAPVLEAASDLAEAPVIPAITPERKPVPTAKKPETKKISGAARKREARKAQKQAKVNAKAKAQAEARARAAEKAAAKVKAKNAAKAKEYARTSYKSSARPASVPVKRKKKSSALIPVLCVAAFAVIAGAAWVGFNQGGAVIDRLLQFGHSNETPELSEPYVFVPEDTESTPVPSSVEDEFQIIQMALPEITPEPIPEPEPTATPVVSSTSVDGMEVEPADDVVSVTTSGTNLRGGPGTGYDIEKTLSRGVLMQRTGTVNGWSQVRYEDEEYYVSSNLVEVEEGMTAEDLAAMDTEEPASTPAPSSIEETLASDPIVTDPGATSIAGTAGSSSNTTASANVTEMNDEVTATSEVNLRSGPSTSYAVVATVPSGTTLPRTGTVNGWSRVTFQGSDVYVINTYISGGSAGSSSSAGSGTLKVVADVNVRSGASTSDSILGIARVGETLTYTGQSADGKWYSVSYNGQTGYVNRKLVSVQSSANASATTVTTTMLANIRSGAGTGYGVLGQVSQGTSLTVTGTEGNWYKVDYNGQTGYINGNIVR